MPTLSRITIYPLKSFDPIEVNESRVLANGALEFDRQFAFADAAGKFINAKRTPLIHLLQVSLDPVTRILKARKRAEAVVQQWTIDADRPALERWFSEYFSTDVTLVEDPDGGFPDDDESPGPTVVSTETLRTVAGWFPDQTTDRIRLRFRANLEVADVEPFWEDRLYGATGVARPFQIGDVVLAGTNPCQRCVVPSRDPATGEVWPEFARRFSQLRAEHFPAWAARDRFDHFYRLTVNTRLIGRGQGSIRVGDAILSAPLSE